MAWLSSASAQGARGRMTRPGASSDGLTVADAMVSYPKRLPLAATVGMRGGSFAMTMCTPR